MNITDLKAKNISLFEGLITNLFNIEKNDIVRPEFGTSNFGELYLSYNEMLEKLTYIKIDVLKILPVKYQDDLIKALKEIYDLLTRIKTYSFTRNESLTGIVEEWFDKYDNFLFEYYSIFSILVQSNLNEKLAKAQNLLETERLELNKIKLETEHVLSSLKGTLAESIISRHSKVFREESEHHKNIAKKWFYATATIAGLTLVVAVCFLWKAYTHVPSSIPEAVQIIANKLILLSALSYILYWVSQNYKSNKHNEILNKHRANALDTFRSFTDACNDIQTKDAVLLQTTQTIFSNRSTGYETSENDQQYNNPVVGMLSKTMQMASSQETKG